eukprot:XP_001693894.1 predicted protein [Chlamydomonas reinhardtii]
MLQMDHQTLCCSPGNWGSWLRRPAGSPVASELPCRRIPNNAAVLHNQLCSNELPVNK